MKHTRREILLQRLCDVLRDNFANGLLLLDPVDVHASRHIVCCESKADIEITVSKNCFRFTEDGICVFGVESGELFSGGWRVERECERLVGVDGPLVDWLHFAR